MTSTIIQHITRLIVVFAFVIAISAPVHSQPPPPPGEHGSPNDQEGTIGGGLLILLTLAGGYGAKKVYDGRRKLR